MVSNYGVNDIKTLEGIEAIRLRPGMYIGSIGPEGVRHITLEIISNAVDEYLNGHCTLCNIIVGADNSITIADNGRGVPFGKAAGQITEAALGEAPAAHGDAHIARRAEKRRYERRSEGDGDIGKLVSGKVTRQQRQSCDHIRRRGKAGKIIMFDL